MTNASRWQTAVDAETTWRQAGHDFLTGDLQVEDTLRSLLNERGPDVHVALKLLSRNPDDELTWRLLPEIVSLVTCAGRYFEWAQELLLQMDHSRIVAQIDPIVASSLEDWEGYSATMALYAQLEDEALLDAHTARCCSHPDKDIRELGE